LTDLGSVLPTGNLEQTSNAKQLDMEMSTCLPFEGESMNSNIKLLNYKKKPSSPLIIDTNVSSNSNLSNTSIQKQPSQASKTNADLKKMRTIRMLSSPTESIEVDDKFLITDRKESISVNNNRINFSNKYDDVDENINDYDKNEYKEDYYQIKKLSLFERSNLKRSKSLDLSSIGECEILKSKKVSATNAATCKDFGFNQRFRMLKDSINYKLKTNTQSLKFLNREYGELSIFSKLKRIKQFKDNLKRYKLKLNNNGDNNSELNSSVDQYDDDDDGQNTLKPPSEHVLSLLEGSSKFWIGKDYCNFVFKDIKNVHSPFQDSIDRTSTPRMPWHDVAGCVMGAAARDIARHFIQRWNYIKKKKVRNNKKYPFLLPKTYVAPKYSIPRLLVNDSSMCHVQVLRSVSTWSAGISKTENSIHEAMKHLIRTSKHYIYIENQFFISNVNDSSVVRNEIAQCLYERIVRASENKENFKVYIFLPLIPGYEGQYGKPSGVLLHAITHYNNESINGLIRKLADSSVDSSKYLCFFGLRTWGELNNRLVSELIYVHSKLIIADDKSCIIGSANINDRSLLGNRDSELSLYIRDTQYVTGIINKEPCQVGRFTSSLRKRLFREFLGEFSHSTATPTSSNSQISPGSPLDLTDPCSDEFYTSVLLKYAKSNTEIYDKIFRVIPCDRVHTFEQLKEYQKVKWLNKDNQAEAKCELGQIKGFIVLYPKKFLCFEKLTPSIGTKEKLLPTTLWT
jgi:phosphatidylserine/phosphatidylglycerophosphate/cardiolipin synthase-like enzyme